MSPAPENAANEVVLYVATTGNDRWSGRLAEPTASGDDGPLATPARARDAIRELHRDGGPPRRVRVMIRGGTYFLFETLTFLPEDSGTVDAPVIYSAYPGESPILSGGRLLSGWTVSQREDGKTLWTIDLPEVAAGKWNFKQLFVDGMRRPRTRLPREGFYRFASLPEGRLGLFTGARSVTVEAGHVKNWKNLGDVEITSLNHWFESHVWIQNVDESTNLVRFKHKALGDLFDEHGGPSRYCVENVFEAMNQPGDWYLDRAAGKLYYLPLPKQNAETTRAIAPRLQFLLRFLGNADTGEKVRHVRFENLKFRHAEWTLPENNPGAVQAAYTVPGAIQLRAAEDCVLYGCEVSQISQYAIEVTRGSQRNKIIACALFDLGGGGVKINPERPVSEGHTGSGGFVGMDIDELGWGSSAKDHSIDAPGLVSSQTTVSDCTIHDGGLFFPSAIGVWLSDAGRNRVRHNHIYNFYYSGISCGWTWSYTPARAYDNRIEYNHIHDIGRGLLSDMGAIYTLGPQPGTVLRGNVIHDIRSNGYGGWGLYTDEGSSYILLENNIVYRTKSGGFHQHYGRDNLVRNNVFAFGDEGQVLGFRPFCVRPYVFQRNIIYHTQGTTTQFDPHASFDKNIYWRDGGGEMSFGEMTFAKWQAIGRDRKGIVADPLLTNPHGGNMSLRSDSPALKLGIKSIDTNKAEPRTAAKRPASFDEWPVDKEVPATILETRLELGTVEDFDKARAASETLAQKNILPADAGERVPMCVIARNWGDTDVLGSIDLRVVPTKAGSIDGPTTLEFQLKPGERTAIDVFASLSSKAEEMMIEARPSVGSAPAPAIALRRRQRLTLGKIEAPGKVEEVFDRLANVVAAPVRFAGDTVADVRLAAAGENLAVLVNVTGPRDRDDGKLAPISDVSVELFGSTPGQTSVIGNIQLLPAQPGRPDTALRQENWIKYPAPEVRFVSRVNGTGYEIAALIPFSLLKIQDSSRFLLDLNAGASAPDGAPWYAASLFGGASCEDNSGFGTIEVK